MMTRREALKTMGISSIAAMNFSTAAKAAAKATERPNILWISCEDTSPHLGCYGDRHAHTPTLDRLAQEGIRYTNAFTVAGVCAPNRSCIITGIYPTTLGTHHMRAGGSGEERSVNPEIPPQVRCFSEYLRKAGYYCTNNVKEDYQFDTPPESWDESSNKAHWRNRPSKSTPFFAVLNYTGTHEGSVRLSDENHATRTKRLKPDQRQDPKQLELPPYYPDTPLTRKHWAHYYELVTAMDYWVSDILKELDGDGLAENTIVFFWSDHGVGMPRAKRWLYDSGTRVPLIVRIPKKLRTDGQGAPGTVERALVSTVDFAPTVLNLAGIPVPGYMQGQAFSGPDVPSPWKYVYGARDRMDDRYDIIRMVRDERYRYIRNYEPFKPYYQHIQTAERGPVMKELRRVHEKGTLPPAAAQFMSEEKPAEELYDLENDPHEINNLADNPEYREVLDRMWSEHVKWMLGTNDLGLIPESELAELEKKYGNRYAILRQPGASKNLERIHSIAALAGRPDRSDRPMLTASLSDENTVVRYWACIGLGNLGMDAKPAAWYLNRALYDESAGVRVAAARALCFMDMESQALPVLTSELKSSNEWTRLAAATVLDDIGEKARPAVDALKQALLDKDNKYVVRVSNHALNILLGTDNQVR